ncbi:hypothetical protein CI1B_45170 [Bradyrhizobium ivorense]|uniref:Uncharacterized protein n=1 Tax=Bradyrhizobium ivorense TaxID=2511166 RepID=A0A508TDM0_9BRAD|nr:MULTISPECIES: hypothetical protein [Bradyrhizobium]QOZ23242.1 hypothetical protein XH93_05940 [Bradyrhizobium sp. CCBAU 51753]VIO67888.1 hypothetical protein CI41S_12620 [Bradyrhizobium ivorense]VIO72869.1 hypothetical protein CI1B_45170 [Bradyrhizobium ivorense]
MTAERPPTDLLQQFRRKYLWWKPVDGRPFSEERVIAQTMDLGTYDDILLLEDAVGQARLVEIMRGAEPGWFSDRSWEFWRGRLTFATGMAIPDKAPRRGFHATV